jgi:RNA-directed DNA polymerase
MEAVLRRENLRAAYRRVARNGGAAGVVGMTVDELATHCREHWPRIREDLLSGRYRPQPVRRVEIPKPGGKGVRMLGIPTVVDRLVQQAFLQVLTPIFDPTFSARATAFVRDGARTRLYAARASPCERVTDGWSIWTSRSSSTG